MSASYILREGFSGLRRTKLATAGAVVTIAIALLFLGLFYLASTNTARLAERVRENVEMEAFLSEPVSHQHRDEIERALLSTDGVERVQFVSKDDAAKIFKEEFGEDINAVLEFNPLPASYKIYLKDGFRTTGRADEVQKKIQSVGGVDTVVYRRDMLGFLERQARTLDTAGLALGLFVALSAIFLVSNTIRLTIAAKSRTIQTLKLVGASRWFVRAPFLIEGVCQGLAGGVCAAGLVAVLLAAAAGVLSPELSEFLRSDPVFYAGLVVAGALLGLLGSMLSVRRFIGETVSS